MNNIQKVEKSFRPFMTSMLAGFLLSMSFAVNANHDVNTNFEGDVIKGYDAVAYFTMGKAVKGLKEFSTKWLGGDWFFANRNHRDLFLADPTKYIPQYGGYCSVSYAIGNEHGSADPENWQVVDGKLYLFYSKRSADNWDVTGSISQSADKKWGKAKAGLLEQ